MRQITAMSSFQSSGVFGKSTRRIFSFSVCFVLSGIRRLIIIAPPPLFILLDIKDKINRLPCILKHQLFSAG